MKNEDEKTIRPTTQIDKTMRPDNPVSKTVRPDTSVNKTLRPDTTSGTLRPQKQQDEINKIIHQDETEFILGKGIKYTVVRVISKNTGEADIFLVESNGKQFVLKLYFIGFKPDHHILDVIGKNAGSGLLVDTLEHGVWTHPQTQQERDYELMVYCEGGSLDQVKINHDENGEKLLGEIALRSSCSLDFLHKQQIIHGDVKPTNFFFRHSGQNIDDLALADFGIAKQCNKDGVVDIPYQERTKIYAAPEYYDIISGEIQISTKSDFFALGMTLITLWIGEETFSKMNEFQLNNQKKHGEIPYPKDMSDRMLQLVKALTHPNPNVRASLDKVVRWANNEDIYDLKSDKDDIRKFKILFNASKNQIANSPEELATFMMEDKSLSAKYLYSGNIAKWLSDNFRPELKQEIEDITENQYPKDKDAGLYAACYLLNSSIPYYDVENKARENSEEIAQSLLNNFEHYKKALADKNDSLFLFFNARGAANVTQTFAHLFKKNGDNRDALLQLIYTLNPALPWTIRTDKNKKIDCYKPEDILTARYEQTFSTQSWDDLISEAFLVWLRYNDPSVEGKIRLQKGYKERQAVVLYNLNPKVSYNFQMDETADDYFFTAEEIGNYMNIRMQEYIEDTNNDQTNFQLGQMCDIDDTDLYDYFKSKGMYDDKIRWIKYCSDLKSKDNVNKAGPYNWIIGVYKAIKGLGYAPYYYFPKSKKKVFTLSEFNQIPSKEVKEEVEKGYLLSWLTLFYQENPALDLSVKYTYEKEMVRYMEDLKKIDPKNIDLDNYNIGRDAVNDALTYLKRRRSMHVWSKILVGVITLLASVVVIYGLLRLDIPIDVEDHLGWISIITAIAFVFGAVMMYFISEDSGCLIYIIVGAIVAGIVYAILYFCIPYIGYIAVGLLLISLIFCLIKSYFNYPIIDKAAQAKGVDHPNLLNPTFEELYLEPLHFAFSDDQSFKSSICDQTYDYADYLSAGTKKLYKQLIFPWILILSLGAVVIIFLPELQGLSKKTFHQENKYEPFIGDWEGTFDNAKTTFSIKL